MDKPDRFPTDASRVFYKIRLLFLLTILTALVSPAGAAEETGLGSSRIDALMADADTLGALSVLDSQLKVTKEKAGLYLLRGQIRLARGEGWPALDDFRHAAKSRDRKLCLAAWLGISRTQRVLLHDNYQAEQACRIGLSIDRNDPALLYERAMIGFSYGGADGYNEAGKYLSRLIEIDPMYGDAYLIWRDSLLFNASSDPGLVIRAMKSWIEAHPDNASLLVDIAWDEFLAGKTGHALASLARLEAMKPGFSSADRELLLARCRLEQGDSLGFQECFERALDIAIKQNEHTRAFAETEVVLTTEISPQWDECGSNCEKATFLRRYWLDSNDDPIEPVNRRLIEHYRRLRAAEQNYTLHNPYSHFQNSGDYNRLLSPQSRIYYFDSELLRKHSAILRLDPRGIVLVRLGEPDKIEKHPGRALQIDNYPGNRSSGSIQQQNALRYRDSEYWHYGKIELLFAYLDGAGDYVFIPQQHEKYVGDMMKILGLEHWTDPGVNRILKYYLAQFLAPNSLDNEVEFYQDDWLPKGERPTATIAVYDSLWGKVEKREGEVFRIAKGKDSDHWLARHRITVNPGKYNYTIRLASGDEKWLGKGTLESVPFEPGSLNLSAVVLGTPPAEGFESPERQGERFVPRTSTRFGSGEDVKVYFEVYNLRPDSAGERSYREWIDVVRMEDGENRIKKYAGKVFQILTFNPSDPQTALTHVFERQADWRGDRAPEIFNLDTSNLKSGAYRIIIQVQDNVSGCWDIEEVFFDIEGSTESAFGN